MSARDGGPAFPVRGMGTWGGQNMEMVNHPGMTLRAHIATEALAALIGHESKDPDNRGEKAVPTLCKFAVEYADGLIAELDK